MASASLPAGGRHLIGATIQGFQPNPNMQEYTWNPNEWWIKRA